MRHARWLRPEAVSTQSVGRRSRVASVAVRPVLSWALLLVLLLGVRPAAADIYRWTDAEGRVHFTQDLSQVPSSQREKSKVDRRSSGPAYNRMGTKAPPASRGLAESVPPVSRATSRRGPIQIPYESRHGAMLVMVRLNDTVTAPFIVDTGASDISIPAAVAGRAGIHVGPNTPRALYTTANGVVSSPIVTVDSVQIGAARVEGARGSISESMQVGLLGGSFFNNFTLQIDPGAQMLTLLPNDRVRSGKNETEWRGRFREVLRKIRTLENYIGDNQFSRESRRRELESKLQALRDRLESLEHEADRAEVPHPWRQG